MTWADLLAAFRRDWWVVALLTVLGMAAGALLTLTADVEYSARARLFVSISQTADTAGAVAGSQFALERVQTYAALVDSPLVLEPVIGALDLDVTWQELSRDVVGNVPAGTVLLDVVVTDPDPVVAARIANSVSERLSVVIEEIERPAGGSSPVDVNVVQPAVVPAGPVSPRARLNLVLGLMLGLAAAAGAVALRQLRDTAITSADELPDLTGVPNLGALPVDRRRRGRLPSALVSDSPLSESVRGLRTNLQFANVDEPIRVVLVTSARQGEGKSTVASSLAISLAQADESVCLVDADLRRPSIEQRLGLSEGGLGLSDVLVEACDLDTAIVRWAAMPLDVLPPGTRASGPSEVLASQAMARLVERLRTTFTWVVIDAPPVLPVADASILSGYVDGVIVVVRFGESNKQDVAKAVESLRSSRATVLGTVVNADPTQTRAAYDYRPANSRQGSGGKRARGRVGG